MRFSKNLAMSITAICTTTAFSFASPASQMTLDQLRNNHPTLRVFGQSDQISKLIAPELATGKTAAQSAQNFLNTWSYSLGANAQEFVPVGPFADGHHVQPIMFNKETGEYKFTGTYYKQTADGLPVYGTRLMLLSRNVSGNPIVNATVDLRDVVGFKKPKRVMNNAALALMSSATRFGTSVTTTNPELMVYAGSLEEHVEPRAAIVFEATVGGNWDADNYQKAELVVDAQTGEILFERNLILHIDGNVSGVATESSGADVCEQESGTPLPYAKVTRGGNTAYTDAYGDYSINGSGNITSKLEGMWFNVNNQSGSDSSISQGGADFMHNSSNSSESYRAEVNSYLHSNIIRDFVLVQNPDYPTIDNQESFPVNVNLGSTCNAYYDYESINFYSSGGGCSNTAFSVVVHHEYGHHLVAVAGSGQGAYGEGMGDVMGVLLTGDNHLARGFYSDDCNNGIRNADNNKQYPCNGGSHDCGQLISGCVWDTLIEMEEAYGAEGHSIVSSLAVNSILLHSGSDISPLITYDWLTLDDDDGDIDNGTPHSEQILAGFAMHSMDDFPEPPDPVDNDTCDTARVLSDGSHSFTTIGGTTGNDSYDDAECGGTYLGVMHNDVWFSYTACESGSMLVSTCDTIDFDSDIVVYQGQCGNMNQVACNGDGGGCGGYSSELTLNVSEGDHYLIRVGGWGDSSEGSGELVLDGPGEPCDTGTPCPGDINEDGDVGVTDLLAVVDMWGQAGGPADVNDDGIVGVSDLLVIIDAWGLCPE